MVPILIEDRIRIPAGIDNLEAFRRWARSEKFPERGRFAFLGDKLWMDMSMEDFFFHNQIKAYINAVLTLLAPSLLGYYFPDGVLLSNPVVNLSTIPDGLFLSFETLEQELARLIKEPKGGVIELEGTPDMTLEVVSNSSVRKDKVVLRELYWETGIAEYWLVDARGETTRFDILRRSPRGYITSRNQGGWIKSNVFGRSFQFTQSTDKLGNPQFTLAVRP